MNVQAIGGGKVHEMHPRTLLAFPFCRSGSQDNGRTKYRNTDAPVDCARCLEQSRRRAAAAALREAHDSTANTAHAPEAPQPAAPEDTRVLNVTDDLRSRTADAILRGLSAGLLPRRVIRRVAWDTLCEARDLGCTPAQQGQVIEFVAGVGAELFVAAGQELARDEQARAQNRVLCGNEAAHGLFSRG